MDGQETGSAGDGIREHGSGADRTRRKLPGFWTLGRGVWFFLGGGAMFLTGVFAYPSPVFMAIGGLSVVYGAISLALPWDRYPNRLKFSQALFGAMLIVVGLGMGTGPERLAFAVSLPLPFIFAGMTQSRGASVVLAAPVGAALAVALHAEPRVMLIALFFVLPIAVYAGERSAHSEAEHRRTEAQIDRMLHAVRVLSHVSNERSAAQAMAALTVDLMSAHGAAVLLSEDGGSRFLNRGFSGHPSLVEAAPLLIDDGAVIEPYIRLERPRSPGARARSTAYIPLLGTEGRVLGVIFAMWRGSKRQLDRAELQGAELIAEEAGHVLERVRATALLAHDARTDPLTQLANRRTFTHALARMQSGDAVVIVDLDHFKAVNDAYGHQAGDETLSDLAACLRTTARQVDTVARYGGEEFAIVLPNAGGRGAALVLSRIRRMWVAEDRMTTFSSGVAVHDGIEDPATTLERADAALYKAKALGRDRDEFAPGTELLLP